VLCEKDGTTIVDESLYDKTLLVELTIILLYGQLKIDFLGDREARSAAFQFNTVMKRVYLKGTKGAEAKSWRSCFHGTRRRRYLV
jgi:hypothetical protein